MDVTSTPQIEIHVCHYCLANNLWSGPKAEPTPVIMLNEYMKFISNDLLFFAVVVIAIYFVCLFACSLAFEADITILLAILELTI